MINCPKCNELIGDNITKCPICKNSISEDYRKEAICNNERLLEDAVANTMSEYSKRARNELIVGIVMILVAVAGMILIASFDLSFVYGIGLFVVILLIYGFCVYKLRIGVCPYCESFMGRGTYIRSHCPRCGGRLR